ncbi:hypothetical protein R1sor_019593 [Riccia sorocarpa]|uniref:Uncharacterized protein n=1 Tax=Riccia sorocarpa TaxID=122646 RepID=A0ABD3IDL4_9MARC
MSRTVHLFQMVRLDTDPVSMGLIGFKNGDTLASLRSKLETIGVFSSFQFWDARVSSPVHPKLESIIFVEECEGKVFVFETAEFPSTSQRDSSASVVTGFVTVDATDPNTRSSTPELTVGSTLVSVSCETTLPREVENYGSRETFASILHDEQTCNGDLEGPEVSKILEASKRYYGIVGDVPVILAEDETRIKPHVRWELRRDTLVGEIEPDLSDFNRLQTSVEVIEALKKGFDEAQNLLIQLNMAPHTGVRNQAWWKTPWIIGKELRLFERGLDTSPVHVDTESDEVGGDDADLSGPVDLWDLSTDVQAQGSDDAEDDGADDLAVVGHETSHVLAEVFDQICSEEEEVKKFDPIVLFYGHSIYKATLVSQLVGNPTLSKDRLTRIKQSIYFNGVKQKPRIEGVPVCILDIGSDCAVLFDTETAGRNTRSQRRRTANANDRLQLDEFLQSL